MKTLNTDPNGGRLRRRLDDLKNRLNDIEEKIDNAEVTDRREYHHHLSSLQIFTVETWTQEKRVIVNQENYHLDNFILRKKHYIINPNLENL